MDHKTNFGKDLCTHACARSKNVRVCVNVHVKMFTHTFMPRAHMFFMKNFTKIVLIVHIYAMTLSLKFHKDPSICWGDIRKITLNMHARDINARSKFWYTHVHIFPSCVRIHAQIFTKFFLVVHCSVMSLSFKFHKNLIFRWGDICKIERCGFFCCYCISTIGLLTNCFVLRVQI